VTATERLTFAQFQPLVDQEFLFEWEDQSLNLTLVEASTLPQHGPSECFTLLFRTQDPIDSLEQTVWTMRHPKLPEQPLFLVPVGPDCEGRMQLESIFN
jgi:hypothetical protein